MVYYIAITYILSGIGFILYRALARDSWTAKQSKNFLMLILIACLTLPFCIDNLFSSTGEQTCLHEHPLPELVFTSYCPSEGGEMELCYELAAQNESFCECTDIAEENLLIFKSKPLFEFFIAYEELLLTIVSLCFVIILCLLALKLLFLVWIIFSSKREKIRLGNYSFTLLHPSISMPLGSFYLLSGYIIWEERLNDLNSKEKEALLWHEASHLINKDTWLKTALGALQSIWLLNPFYYLVNREVDRLCEFVADSLAVEHFSNPVEYASLLLKLKTEQQTPFVHHFGAHTLSLRIKRLVRNSQEKSSNSHLSKKNLLLSASFCLTILVSSSYYFMPMVANQFDSYKAHMSLLTEKQNTGKELFCKACLLRETPTGSKLFGE